MKIVANAVMRAAMFVVAVPFVLVALFCRAARIGWCAGWQGGK